MKSNEEGRILINYREMMAEEKAIKKIYRLLKFANALEQLLPRARPV